MACWALRHECDGHDEWRLHRGAPDALDELPLYVISAARDEFGDLYARKRRLEFYSISWLKQGECWYWSEHTPRPFQVAVGQVILAAPGVLHAWGGRDEPCREDYAAFIGPTVDCLQTLGMFDPSRPVLELPDPARIGTVADILRNVSSSIEAQVRAGLVIQALLADAHYRAGGHGTARHAVITDLLKLIGETPEVHRSSAEMADLCSLSESHFRKLFCEQVGMPPHTYCERTRMDRACELLRYTTRPVSEIAAVVGYTDPLYFSKRFSAVVGIAPRDYRSSTRLA